MNGFMLGRREIFSIDETVVWRERWGEGVGNWVRTEGARDYYLMMNGQFLFGETINKTSHFPCGMINKYYSSPLNTHRINETAFETCS